jgi:hypothetical protein
MQKIYFLFFKKRASLEQFSYCVNGPLNDAALRITIVLEYTEQTCQGQALLF